MYSDATSMLLTATAWSLLPLGPPAPPLAPVDGTKPHGGRQHYVNSRVCAGRDPTRVLQGPPAQLRHLCMQTSQQGLVDSGRVGLHAALWAEYIMPTNEQQVSPMLRDKVSACRSIHAHPSSMVLAGPDHQRTCADRVGSTWQTRSTCQQLAGATYKVQQQSKSNIRPNPIGSRLQLWGPLHALVCCR